MTEIGLKNNSTLCYATSDLHGRKDSYEKLFAAVRNERPGFLLICGDLLPHSFIKQVIAGKLTDNFIDDFLRPGFEKLRQDLGAGYPEVLVIMGNDDPRAVESHFNELGKDGLWTNIHLKKKTCGEFSFYGCAWVPPTPFQLKDWERYDVSRYVDPGCFHPYAGIHTIDVGADELEYTTIASDIEKLTGNDKLGSAIFLFHSPPYKSALDRAALDGIKFDHAPMDVHVGSIAIQRFIEKKQPSLTLHGHIHESTRLSGKWKEQSGRTWSFNAATDDPLLCILSFNLENIKDASRKIV